MTKNWPIPPCATTPKSDTIRIGFIRQEGITLMRGYCPRVSGKEQSSPLSFFPSFPPCATAPKFDTIHADLYRKVGITGMRGMSFA